MTPAPERPDYCVICGSSEHHGDEHHDVRGHFPYHKYAAPVTDAGLDVERLAGWLHDEMNFRIGIPDHHPDSSSVDEPTCQLLAAHLASRQAEKETA